MTHREPDSEVMLCLMPVFSGGGSGGDLALEHVRYAAMEPGGRYANSAVASFDLCPLNPMLAHSNDPGVQFRQFGFGAKPSTAIQGLQEQMPEFFGNSDSHIPSERVGDFMPDCVDLMQAHAIGVSKSPAGTPLVMQSSGNLDSMVAAAKSAIEACANPNDPRIISDAAYFTYFAGAPSGTGSAQMIMLLVRLRKERASVGAAEEWHRMVFTSRSFYLNQDGMWRTYGANQAATFGILNHLMLHGTRGTGRFAGPLPCLPEENVDPGLADEVAVYEKVDQGGGYLTRELLFKMQALELRWRTKFPEPYRKLREWLMEKRSTLAPLERATGLSRRFSSSGFRQLQVAPEVSAIQKHLIRARIAQRILKGDQAISYEPLSFSADRVGRLGSGWNTALAREGVRSQEVDVLVDKLLDNPAATLDRQKDALENTLATRVAEIIEGASGATGDEFGDKLSRVVRELKEELSEAIGRSMAKPGRERLLRELRSLRDGLAQQKNDDPIIEGWINPLQEAVDEIQELLDGDERPAQESVDTWGRMIRTWLNDAMRGTRTAGVQASASVDPVVKSAENAARKCVELFSAKRSYEVTRRLNQVRSELVARVVNPAISELEQQVSRLESLFQQESERARALHGGAQVKDKIELSLVPTMEVLERVTQIPDGALEAAVSALTRDGSNASAALDVVPEGRINDVELILESPEAMQRIREMVSKTRPQARIDTSALSSKHGEELAEYKMLMYPSRYQRVLDTLNLTLDQTWSRTVVEDSADDISGIAVNVIAALLPWTALGDGAECESDLNHLRDEGGDEYDARFMYGRYAQLPGASAEGRTHAAALAALALILRPDASYDESEGVQEGWETTLLELPADQAQHNLKTVRSDSDATLGELLQFNKEVKGLTLRCRGVDLVGNREPHFFGPLQQYGNRPSEETDRTLLGHYRMFFATRGGAFQNVIPLGIDDLDLLIDEIQINTELQQEIHNWILLNVRQHKPGALELMVLQFLGRLSQTIREIKLFERSGSYESLSPDDRQLFDSLIEAADDAEVLYHGLHKLARQRKWARKMERIERRSARRSQLGASSRHLRIGA